MIGGATVLGVKAGGAWSELLSPSAKSTYKIVFRKEREREGLQVHTLGNSYDRDAVSRLARFIS